MVKSVEGALKDVARGGSFRRGFFGNLAGEGVQLLHGAIVNWVAENVQASYTTIELRAIYNLHRDPRDPCRLSLFVEAEPGGYLFLRREGKVIALGYTPAAGLHVTYF